MSRKTIITLLIFIVIFAFALLVGGTIPYFLLYVFSLTFLIPLVHCLIVLRALKGSVDIPKESLFTGESINIVYQVKNNSILPIPYLEIKRDISRRLSGLILPNLIFSLRKKEVFIEKETVLLKRRGYYELGEIEIIIQDVFGFYTFKKKILSPASLLVYPETIFLSTFKITASHQSGELLVKNTAFQDKSRVATLREYREGDSVKAIHWKLSAKKDSTIVKNYENRGDTSVVIFIDNEATLFSIDKDRRIEDKAVDASLSIIEYCLSQNIEVILEIQDGKSQLEIIGQQKSDLKPFLGALARFEGNGSLDFHSFLMDKIEFLKKGSTVVIITPNFNKSMGAHGIQLKMRNLNPLFIVITDEENKTGYLDVLVERKLKQDGIPIYILDYKNSINEGLEVYHG